MTICLNPICLTSLLTPLSAVHFIRRWGLIDWRILPIIIFNFVKENGAASSSFADGIKTKGVFDMRQRPGRTQTGVSSYRSPYISFHTFTWNRPKNEFRDRSQKSPSVSCRLPDTRYRKIPKISPGAYIFSKALFEGLIFRWAYIRRGLSTEGNLRFKTDWASL